MRAAFTSTNDNVRQLRLIIKIEIIIQKGTSTLTVSLYAYIKICCPLGIHFFL